eukprot:6264001-Amphidinium_carterae.1
MSSCGWVPMPHVDELCVESAPSDAFAWAMAFKKTAFQTAMHRMIANKNMKTSFCSAVCIQGVSNRAQMYI